MGASVNYFPLSAGKTNGGATNKAKGTSSFTATSSWFSFVTYFNGGGTANDAAQWLFRINGINYVVSNSAGGWGSTNANNRIGVWNNDSLHWDGDIAEFGCAKAVTFDGALQTKFDSYFARYGL